MLLGTPITAAGRHNHKIMKTSLHAWYKTLRLWNLQGCALACAFLYWRWEAGAASGAFESAACAVSRHETDRASFWSVATLRWMPICCLICQLNNSKPAIKHKLKSISAVLPRHVSCMLICYAISVDMPLCILCGTLSRSKHWCH